VEQRKATRTEWDAIVDLPFGRFIGDIWEIGRAIDSPSFGALGLDPRILYDEDGLALLSACVCALFYFFSFCFGR
jgi:hypothetical protein